MPEIQVFTSTCLTNVYNRIKSLPLKRVIVAYDWDLTLKIPGHGKPPKPELKGGESTRKVLTALKKAGARQVIVSATRPSTMNWSSLATEVKALRIDNIFNVNVKPRTEKLATGNNMVIGGDLILSGYDKADAIDAVRGNHTIVVFADDFVVNALQFAFYWLDKKVDKVFSTWLDPKPLVEQGIIKKQSPAEDSYSAQYRDYRCPAQAGMQFSTVAQAQKQMKEAMRTCGEQSYSSMTRKLHKGPRGGFYHYTSSGRRCYKKNK